jgi:hypothetical protein
MTTDPNGLGASDEHRNTAAPFAAAPANADV